MRLESEGGACVDSGCLRAGLGSWGRYSEDLLSVLAGRQASYDTPNLMQSPDSSFEGPQCMDTTKDTQAFGGRNATRDHKINRNTGPGRKDLGEKELSGSCSIFVDTWMS